MREKRKQLNRNGWQARLYRFVWRDEPKFIGYCPLFWATWVNIFLIPIVIIGSSVEWTVKLLCDFWPESRKQKTYYDPEPWRKHIPFTKEDAEKENARQERLEKRKEQFIKYAQYLVKPALAVSAVVAGWGIWKLILLVWGLITLKVFVEVVINLSILAFLSAIIFGIVKIFQFIWKVKKSVEPRETGPSFFNKCFSAISEGASFLVDTVSMLYEKKCPLIEWSDETKPIEKIKSE